ncbi:hypothetical protein C3942_02060 [Solimonas fluminis]|uniref:DUF1302 domain-containing protein n=1 Tax=Solimonas fluminis TaxID=2086571 RepID=A0A2S5TL38_9GAMM|nr:DUF1302 family protein [Solimonas fluminis]PPE75699.1 hypothetical protein C3942_02060 [Solimonas fluminis]
MSRRIQWPFAHRGLAVACAMVPALASHPARAGEFELFGLDGDWQMQLGYAAAMRLHDADDRIIDAPGSPDIPVPETLKIPESANYDDGDRNFDKGALFNNRITVLGELGLTHEDYGIRVRADAFYDDVYRRRNDNRQSATLSQTTGNINDPHEGPVDRFTDAAEYYDGARARLLDAYVYGTWYLGEEAALNLRLGRHIAAWGESLFFSGIALAQSPADATKANVPGADVKSILLPVNQVSMQLALTPELTLLGQYKLEYKSTELNPVGEYFSVADVVGPGAQFTYGLENPLYLPNLADVNLLSTDLAEYLQLVADFANLPLGGVTDFLSNTLAALDPFLPDLPLQIANIPMPGQPKYINVLYNGEKKPSDHGQYGVGLKYQMTPTTGVGLYHLRYHSTTPAPVQTYGSAPLLVGPGGVPILATGTLGLQVPVTYQPHYFDGIHMTAASFSTALFGVNVAGEAIYRDGVDVLVDLSSGLLGPVPSPTRAKIIQGLLSAIYSFGPQDLFGLPLWDTLSVVGETGYVHVQEVDPVCNPYECNTKLHNSKDSSAISMLFIFDRKNVLRGWDLTVPVYAARMLEGQSSLTAAFGPLAGIQDKRLSVGLNMTYLQQFTLGITWAGYFGTPHFAKNPYADRDFVGVSAKYSF